MKDFNREAKEEILMWFSEGCFFDPIQEGDECILFLRGDTIIMGVYKTTAKEMRAFLSKAREIKRLESIKIFKELLD